MESDSEQPQLWEFSIGSNMQLQKTKTVCNIFDILGTGNIATKHSNNGKVFRNTPVVQMTTADTDKDSVDELVVTAGMNNTKADVNNRQSRMFIYDNITEDKKGSSWNKTFELDTKGYNNGNQRLRWASSSVGNLVMTGSGADYPEIITAGWVDKKTNKDSDLTHDIGAYVTSCSKTTKKGNSAIGTYAKSEVPAIGSNGQPQVSGFTKDGHYRDDVQSLVVVDTFAADGVNAEASVLIMDTIPMKQGRVLMRNSVRIILITVIMELAPLSLQMDWYRMRYPVIFPAMKKAGNRLYLQPVRNEHQKINISIRPIHTKRQVNLSGSVTQQDIVLVRRGMRTHLYVHQILTQTVRSQELKTYL
jgi:hypothetical protein